MEAILEPLVRSPKLRLYVDELTKTLRREQEAREKFRESLNEDIRAEFINGEVFVHSPAKDAHTATVKRLNHLLDIFVGLHHLGVVRCEQALTEFTRNDYAPDICFWSREKAVNLEPKTFFYPVPDFICEVLSPSTEQNDRGIKLVDYSAHGVIEYWIVDPDERTIENYGRHGSELLKGAIYRSGTIRSKAVPNFVIPIEAVFEDEANLRAIAEIILAKPRQ